MSGVEWGGVEQGRAEESTVEYSAAEYSTVQQGSSDHGRQVQQMAANSIFIYAYHQVPVLNLMADTASYG